MNITSKCLLASILIHGVLLSYYFIYIYEKPIKIASKEKIISIDLKTFNLPKQSIKKAKSIEKPKKIANLKKLKKKPVHKPIVEKKIKTIKKLKEKNEIVKKDILKIQKAKPIQKKIVEIPKNTKENINKQQQIFLKTNFAIIRDMVLSNLNYPKVAKRMGWEGKVIVKIIVDTRGKLLSYKIVFSSNRKQLDQAALKAVEKLINSQLPKPKTITTLKLPIVFSLQ